LGNADLPPSAGEQQNGPRLQDRRDPNSETLAGNVVAEASTQGASRRKRQRRMVCSHLGRRSSLVECDVPVVADPENGEIDASAAANVPLASVALVFEVAHLAVGELDEVGRAP
jgi:hypothetical protein